MNGSSTASGLLLRLRALLDRELVYAASRVLPDELFHPWLYKHGLKMGRYNGAVKLGITPEQFRYRAAKAEREMREHLEAA